jgi:hypothetical protein
MKLKLKHLAPYLPYGLKCSANNGCFVNHSLSGLINEIAVFDFENGEQDFRLGDFKPILKPLSDLTPYENGELDGMGETNDLILIRLVESTSQHCDAYDEWRDSYFDNPIQERILQAPYEVFDELTKQHFDVFGLIDAGLAIDINTLSNEKV